MQMQHFDRRIAGAKTLWILSFPPIDPTIPLDLGKPKIEFLIPSPFVDDEWMPVKNLGLNDQMLTSLEHFQIICDQTRKFSDKNLPNQGLGTDQAQQAAKEIKTLNDLVRYFNDMLKRFRPPQEDPPKI